MTTEEQEWEDYYGAMVEQLHSLAYAEHEAGHPVGKGSPCLWCLGEEMDDAAYRQSSPMLLGPYVALEPEQRIAPKWREMSPSIEFSPADLAGEWDYSPLAQPVKQFTNTVSCLPTTRITVSEWFRKKEELASRELEGVVVTRTPKAILFNGSASIHKSANCLRCGREITHPVSISLGYGPDCCEYLGISRADLDAKDALLWMGSYVDTGIHKTKVELWIPLSQIEGGLP